VKHPCSAQHSPSSWWRARLSAERGRVLLRRRADRGFTLIEAVIVMAIIGVLMAIALPSYREHVRKAARADAQAFLTDVASRQQQYLVDKRSYATSVATLNMAPSAHLKTKFEDPILVEAPNVVPPTFRLTARAVGDQAYDKCPTLTLDSAGNREPPGCW